MKTDVQFFDTSARILQEETIQDVVQNIASKADAEDPFYVLDVGNIVQKIKMWKLKMPRVKPFYAVKCNDNKTVLQILAALGIGFDCASKNEINKVLGLGVDPSRIIFAHPCKPISHLKAAALLGLELMTFDNETELAKVKSVMPNARLVLRIRCDAAESQCPLGVKFGASVDDTFGLLTTAVKLGLNVVGVSFHVGSGCREPAVFLRAIAAAKKVFEEARGLGFRPDLLDIGGGFPGTSGSTLNEIAHYVNAALAAHFPHDDVSVIAEPGRYVVASAFTLATNVIAKRRVEAGAAGSGGGGEEAASSFMYYTNDGVYGSFNCILYDHQEVEPKVLKPTSGGQKVYASSLWGPTCDSLDQIVERWFLPELFVGDWIVWEDMGAYTIAAAGTFNGFPQPRVHVVVPHHTWIYFEELSAKCHGLMAHADSEETRDVQNVPKLIAADSIYPNSADNPTLDEVAKDFSLLTVVQV